MKIKKIVCGFLGLISMGLLAGCGNKVDSALSASPNSDGDNNSTGEINLIKNDKLAVDQNRCVGCGKCARIAPSNFEMNAQANKAQVKSNEINNQTSIDRAIASCHPRAIVQ